MLTKTNKFNSNRRFLLRFAFILPLILCVFAVTANSQKNDIAKTKNLPVWQTYKGVAIGMTVPEVIEKLGAPQSETAEGYFYMYTENETAQILFDTNKHVRTISVIYTAEFLNPPKFIEVFGKTAEDDSKPDGSVFKMVRYPEAGYWVSFNRMGGEQAMVIIVIQKL